MSSFAEIDFAVQHSAPISFIRFWELRANKRTEGME
jgi:hypothetical protein